MIGPFVIDLETGVVTQRSDELMSVGQEPWVVHRLDSLPRFEVRSSNTNFDRASGTGDTRIRAFDTHHGAEVDVCMRWSLENSKLNVAMMFAQAFADPEKIAKQMTKPPTKLPVITDLSYERTTQPRSALQRAVAKYVPNLPLISTPPQGFNCRSVVNKLDLGKIRVDVKKTFPPLVVRAFPPRAFLPVKLDPAVINAEISKLLSGDEE
jgi:hypothetical protein